MEGFLQVIYVPEYIDGNCAYIYSTDIIRVYDSQPRQNTTIAYKDYYIKSSYIYNEGSTTFSNYTTLPTCINSSRITTDVYYRNDLPDILWIFFVFCIFGLYIPLKIFLRLFRRYQ